MSGTFGITTIQQFLQNILIAFSNINATLKTLAIGASANNNFTGNNTFTGTNTFKPPPIFSAGAISIGTIQPAGLLSNQLSVVGIGNGADTTDDNLFIYTIPASAFDVAGRSIAVEAFGLFAPNANNKTVKLFFGTAAFYNSGVVTQNNTGWYLRAVINKASTNAFCGAVVAFGGTGILSQVGVGSTAQADASPIVIRLTGASPTTGAASDVVANGLTVEFLN